MISTFSPKPQRGVTLVEFAIVITIIGLLTGGIMAGRSFITNGKITATITQVKRYGVASQTFHDSYDNWPGDMLDAGIRLPGCNANCNAGTQQDNGFIGVKAFSNGWNTQTQLPNAGGAPHRETLLFWLHLLQGNYITGVTSEAMTTTTAQFGITQPSAPLKGGFNIGYFDGLYPLPGSPMPTPTPPNTVMTPGHYIYTVVAPTRAPNSNASAQSLTARLAAIIDRKIDDGFPSSGQVLAFGVATSCFSGTTAPGSYNEDASPGEDCGVAIRIHK